MQEIEIVLEFTQHCLGDARYKNRSRMLRAPDGRVMLLASWWAALFKYAAQVLNRHHDAVTEIDWDPIVDGETSEYKRYYAPGKWTLHEAFYPGDEITVKAVVPSSIPLEDVAEMLRISGRYRGISPYRKDKQYGTFTVVSVKPRKKEPPHAADSDNSQGCTIH
jgi:hypothetical protein